MVTSELNGGNTDIYIGAMGAIVDISPGAHDGAATIKTPNPTIASATGTSMATLGRRNFWAAIMTPITNIHVTLMTPNASNISISPMLDPTQSNPNKNPERAFSRQRRRKNRLSGVSS
jgi:hypothetical protein